MDSQVTYQSSEHLVHKSSERPPINGLGIAFSFQNLGSYVWERELKKRRKYISQLDEQTNERSDSYQSMMRRMKKTIPKYSGVPQNVAVLASSASNPSLEIPKSVRMIWPASVKRMFSGLRSR